MRPPKRVWRWVLPFTIVAVVLCSTTYVTTTPLVRTYNDLGARVVLDRQGHPVYIPENIHEQYTIQATQYPETLTRLVVKKEDRFFYYHPGINPVSMVHALVRGVTGNGFGGSSTITQQLVKMLLQHEHERTITHKLQETLLAVALDLRYTKEDILTMYLNTVHLGNQVQGFAMASWVYFGRPVDTLAESELVQLIATLSNPSNNNPWALGNIDTKTQLAERFGTYLHQATTTTQAYHFNTDTAFEVLPLIHNECGAQCSTTIDHVMQTNLRTLLAEHLDGMNERNATHGAIVVISVPDNEVLTVVGSPDPHARASGNQINMAMAPRPIGSTIKPFIYAESFALGARPYTLVDDREYKYTIGTGFPLYPKNFDGTYQGTVTLHHALANSLNTPSVQLLEYIGLHSFYTLLHDRLSFRPIAPLESYAYGIALGGLEMDLLTLTHYFTVFPHEGLLQPLHVMHDRVLYTPQGTVTNTRRVFETPYTQLVTKILVDRSAGVEQFGMKSTLEVFDMETAVKTGTSRDFHDSWSVGYTPDYVVGVWIGNADNKPMDGLSGAVAAGNMWRAVMEYLRATPYNTGASFSFDQVVAYPSDGTLQYGLAGDIVSTRQNVLHAHQPLILSPHDHDVLLYTNDTVVPLKSSAEASWSVQDTMLGTGTDMVWSPLRPGTYEIRARSETTTELVTVIVTTDTTAQP